MLGSKRIGYIYKINTVTAQSWQNQMVSLQVWVVVTRGTHIPTRVMKFITIYRHM